MVKIMPKIITLLELFASGGDFAFSEIVVRTGLTRSNVSHLLQSMCECGMLKKEEYGKYRRGERLLRLCLSTNPWQELLGKAERSADNLMLWLNELAVIGMRDRDHRLTLVKRKPMKNLQVEQESGRAYPADWYSTANGRVLLAYAPAEMVKCIVRRVGLPDRKTWREAVSLPKLEKELERIRTQGYATISVDEVVRALGIPVRDASDEPLLSMSTAFPVFSCRKSEAEIIEYMRYLAATLEDELKVSGIRVADLKRRSGGFRS